MRLPTDVHPTTALVRLAHGVKYELHAITILETRRAVHHLLAAPECLDDAARKRREPARPTALTHPLGHVILIDLHLKDVDANEVVKQVKKSSDLQLTKVIAMSGKLTDAEAQGLTAQGFDSFLRKPFHVRQVIQAVEDAMAIVY